MRSRLRVLAHVVAPFVSVAMLCFLLTACARLHDPCLAIQRRIDRLPKQGGAVLVSAGVYECGKPVVVNKDGASLEGQGPRTVLRLKDGANSPVVIIGSRAPTPMRPTSDVRLAKLTIDGNREKQSFECHESDGCVGKDALRNNGISIRRGIDIVVEDVEVYNARSGGLVAELGSRRVSVRRFTSHGNQWDGLAATETEDSSFSDLTLSNNLKAGLSFDLRFNRNTIANATLEGNGSSGLFMREATGNTFDRLFIRGSHEDGVFLSQVDRDPARAPTRNTFRDSVIENSRWAGISAKSASAIGNSLVGVRFTGNGSGCIVEAVPGLLTRTDVTC